MIKNKLKQKLKEKNITAYRLAKALSVQRSLISRVLNHKHNDINLSTALKIANFLDCKIEDLFYESEE